MKTFQLSNGILALEVVSRGAELRSIKDIKTGREYLWCADPAYWGRTSPILFPLVGNYRDKQCCYEGKIYEMSQHGFARDMDFVLVSRAEDELWFALIDTEETLKKYPFRFRLSLGYRLEGRHVEVLWRVENPNAGTMHFSIGGHPAFNCPPTAGEQQTDCRLAFDTEGPLRCSVLNAKGLVSERVKLLELEEGQLNISEDLFDEDALILENHQAQQVSLIDSRGQRYLTVSFDAPLFGIWSPAGKHAPFVCIEPWYGRADRADFSQRLEEREWSCHLEPGAVFEKSYRIEIL